MYIMYLTYAKSKVKTIGNKIQYHKTFTKHNTKKIQGKLNNTESGLSSRSYGRINKKIIITTTCDGFLSLFGKMVYFP